MEEIQPTSTPPTDPALILRLDEDSPHESKIFLLKNMYLSGYHTWGFVVYRCTYSNDLLWAAFVDTLQSVTESMLERSELLGHRAHLKWTFIEDRETFEDASVDTVRTQFQEWVGARNVTRDGPGVDSPNVLDYSIRFRYCLMVDKTCLESLRKLINPYSGICHILGSIIIIDSWAGRPVPAEPESPVWDRIDDEENEEDEDSSESEEELVYGPPEGQGWMYVDANLLTAPTIVLELCTKGLTTGIESGPKVYSDAHL